MKLDADCVLYMAQGEGDPDGAQVVEPLEAACAQAARRSTAPVSNQGGPPKCCP